MPETTIADLKPARPARGASGSVLVADDEPLIRDLMRDILEEEGYAVTAVASGNEAITKLSKRDYDLVLSDVRMQDGDGPEVLAWVKKEARDVPVIMVTGHASVESAIQAMKLGAWEYIRKPFDATELLVLVRNAIENTRLRRQNAQFRRQLAAEFSFSSITGESRVMREAIERLKAAAGVSAPVLISGESGTGKELFAAAVHYNSLRRELPLVTARLSGIAKENIDAELFGSAARGSGRAREQRGLIESANGSSIYIDEVADLPLPLQAKLLRVMQEGVVVAAGGTAIRPVDVRVICGTRRDLEGEVVHGAFREDLYYRLLVLAVQVPPLRERRGDIPALAYVFLRRSAEEHHRPARDFSPDALEALSNYRWPGNVRELRSVIEQAVLSAREELLDSGHLKLPETSPVFGSLHGPIVRVPQGDLTLKEVVSDVIAQVESARLRETLEQTKGDRTLAANLLGVSLRTMMYKIKEYGLGATGSGEATVAAAGTGTGTVRDLLVEIRRMLQTAGLDGAVLESEQLLAKALGVSRSALLAMRSVHVQPEAEANARAMAARRMGHEPMAYIVESAEFYGRDFAVSRDVLIPRTDTESVVNVALGLTETHEIAQFADLGTGSGCIAVTLLAERSKVTGHAVDISQRALDIAARNAATHGVSKRLRTHRGNWFSALPPELKGALGMIVSNPPYIPRRDIAGLDPEVASHEPRLALSGADWSGVNPESPSDDTVGPGAGPDGLDAIRHILAHAGEWLLPGGFVVIELGFGQSEAAREAALQFHYSDVSLTADTAGVPRVLAARVPL